MQFPVFQIPYLGAGMSIALDAVIHVIISHGIAIGLGAIVVFCEYIGWKKNSPQWDALGKKLLSFTVIVTTTVGALTGVGIWFVTSVIEPRGIGSLLRIFFWPWFMNGGSLPLKSLPCLFIIIHGRNGPANANVDIWLSEACTCLYPSVPHF